MKKSALSFLALASLACAASADPSTWTISLVGVSNTSSPGTGIHSLAYSDSTGPLSTASTTASFTGMDGAGATQTMTFSGTTTDRAEFGRLRSSTSGSLTNSYYNAGNPAYVRPDGSVNPAGSPDSLTSLGFAGFNDTLHFGGSLGAGYTARYIFRVDGTNTGTGYLADMAVQIAGDAPESFFAYDPGYNVATWATVGHAINGIDPQEIHVQFSTQVVFDTFNLTDGGDFTGSCDFSATLVLAAIEVRDANGALATGWTVTSDSGTVYAQAVPAPAPLLVFGSLLPMLRRRRHNR